MRERIVTRSSGLPFSLMWERLTKGSLTSAAATPARVRAGLAPHRLPSPDGLEGCGVRARAASSEVKKGTADARGSR